MGPTNSFTPLSGERFYPRPGRLGVRARVLNNQLEPELAAHSLGKAVDVLHRELQSALVALTV
jgi:hypothetical protein